MKTELLNPQNSAVIFIDFQPQMVFSKLEVIFCTFLTENNFVNALILFIRAGVANIDLQTLFNNVLLRANAAKTFKVPTILTTVEPKSFSGNMWPQLLDIFPDQKPIERSSMNSWEDGKFVAAVAGSKTTSSNHIVHLTRICSRSCSKKGSLSS